MVIDKSSTYYYHADALGSVRMITYNDATMVYTDGYQPYGLDNGTPSGSFKNRATDKFTGKPYSSATIFYYGYQRWYDPATGRFISQDPVAGFQSDPQSLNRYLYARDTPTTFTDPSGMIVVPRSVCDHCASNQNSECDPSFNSISDFFGSTWRRLTDLKCVAGELGLSGTVTGAYGSGEGSAAAAGPAGAVIFGFITILWVVDNWDSISGTWRTPPDPGGSGDGSGRGSGTGPTTTPGFTDGIGSITTFPGTNGLTAGLGPFGTSALRSQPAGNLLIDNIYGTLAKPIRWVKNHPNIGRACVVGAVVAGMVLFAWQIGESVRQTRGSIDPRGDIAIGILGCIVAIGFLAAIPG